MSIRIVCPGCSASFKVRDEFAGKRAKCPTCSGPIVVPSPFNGWDTIRMPLPSKPKPPADGAG